MTSNLKAGHYVDNVKFAEELIKRKKLLNECMDSGNEPPRISEYLGKTILDICTHFSYRPNFINYSYRHELISDAVENCLSVIDNFDPEKSMNPFSYFTQIAFYAFLRRIEKEQKEAYIKAKILEYIPVEDLVTTDDTLNEEGMTFIESIRDNYYFDVLGWEDKRQKVKKSVVKIGVLEKFME